VDLYNLLVFPYLRTSPNIDRFQKFFYTHKFRGKLICNKAIVMYPTAS